MIYYLTIISDLFYWPNKGYSTYLPNLQYIYYMDNYSIAGLMKKQDKSFTEELTY